MVMEKTPEELLIKEKELLFTNDMEESKERQQRIIARCDNTIDEAQNIISTYEGKKLAAQKLLEELEARFPTEV